MFKFSAFLKNGIIINDVYPYFLILLFKFVISGRDVTNIILYNTSIHNKSLHQGGYQFKHKLEHARTCTIMNMPSQLQGIPTNVNRK